MTVISVVSDELKSDRKARGVRYWAAVEIRSERWFQVETCAEVEGCETVKSVIANNFETVMKLVVRFGNNQWTSVRLYTRLPLRAAEGFVFETINEVFEVGGSYYYLLSSGLMLHDNRHDNKRTNLSHLSDARTVYTTKQLVRAW